MDKPKNKKPKSNLNGYAEKMKLKDPVLLGDTYGLAREIAGVSDKVLMNIKEAKQLENNMGSVLFKKNVNRTDLN